MAGTIAPHRGQEVRLVQAGLKPLATVERGKDKSQYAMAVSLIAAGSLAGHVRPTADDPGGEVVFTRPSNARVIADYLWLAKEGVQRYGIKEYHRKIGALFGYSLDDIEAFIEAEVQCNCIKCGG